MLVRRYGNRVPVDAVEGRHDLEASEAKLAGRPKTWKAPPMGIRAACCVEYADEIGAAREGAALHADGRAELVCYAEI